MEKRETGVGGLSLLWRCENSLQVNSKSVLIRLNVQFHRIISRASSPKLSNLRQKKEGTYKSKHKAVMIKNITSLCKILLRHNNSNTIEHNQLVITARVNDRTRTKGIHILQVQQSTTNFCSPDIWSSNRRFSSNHQRCQGVKMGILWCNSSTLNSSNIKVLQIAFLKIRNII